MMRMLRRSVRVAAPRGRHRLGRPGLRHYRVRPVTAHPSAWRSTPTRTDRRGPTEASGAARRPAFVVSTVTASVAMAAVLVSGWYAAAGASAIAEMVAR